MTVYPQFISDINKCMFCNKTGNTTSLRLSYYYGFVNCKDCICIAEKTLKDWIHYNKKISWLYFFILTKYDVDIENESFNIIRSDTKIDSNWFININGWIMYNEKLSDYLLPLVKNESKKKILFKNVLLKDFCKLNLQFNYNFIKNSLKNYI